MALKIRIKLQTTTVRKQRDINTLNELEAKNISVEKDKRNNICLYATFKTFSFQKFEQFAASNSLKYEKV